MKQILSQVDILRESLEAGNIEDQITMLRHLGIGNHTAVVARLRDRYAKEGKGRDYVATTFSKIKCKTRYSDKRVRYAKVASYYIPEKLTDKKRKKLGL